MYNIKNKRGELLRMKDGTPFTYTLRWTADLGVKYLRPKTPRSERPIRVVSA